MTGLSGLAPVIEEIAARVGTALGLTKDEVYIDRYTGQRGGQNAVLSITADFAPMTLGRYAGTLTVVIGAELDAVEGQPMLVQRLDKTALLMAALTWTRQQGTPIEGIASVIVTNAAITEPMEDLDESMFGVGVTWQGQFDVAKGGQAPTEPAIP